MRIDVDAQRCVGHGICEATAPELFELGADAVARVLVNDVGDSHGSAVAAVAGCPAHALSILD